MSTDSEAEGENNPLSDQRHQSYPASGRQGEARLGL